jgi:hypothetical protein
MPNDPRSPTNPSRQPGQTVRFSFPKVDISELTALSTSIADSVAIKQSTLAELSKSIATTVTINDSALAELSKSIATTVTINDATLAELSKSVADSVAIKQSTLAELSKSIAASFAANEVALTAASKSITAIALLVGPPSVPRSTIPPDCVHLNACVAPDEVAAPPTTKPESLTA